MRAPRTRELVQLRAYIDEHSRHPLMHRAIPVGIISPFVLVAMIMLAVFSTRFIPGWAAFLFLPLALILVFFGFGKLNEGLWKPRDEHEAEAVRRHELAQHMNQALQRRQIHPLAARLLEACAHHRSRILAAVERPGWESSHLRGIREQATEAADEAMAEALTHCSAFIGPDHSRGAAWKDLVQDVAEGQIGDAVRRFQNMMEADRAGEVVDRRKLPPELWPVYDIAVKMQKLSAEMQSTARSLTDPADAPRESALDHVLSQLGAIREAEKELESEQRLGQG